MLNALEKTDQIGVASRHIGEAVGQIETSAQRALRDGALMVASLMDGVIATGINDQTVIEQAIAGFKSVADAQRSYADMHRRLAAIGRQQGVDIRAYGDCGPTPSSTTATLQVV